MVKYPYCGKCDTFIVPRFTGPNAADIIWVCECPVGQVDSECLAKGHVWVRTGTVTAGVDFGVEEAEAVSVIDWGPVKCLRCEEPAPEEERIAALEAALRQEQGHWRAAIAAHQGCETIDIDFASAVEAESRITRTLEAEGCVCVGPPMQPCGPKCSYPYTDFAKAGEGWLPPEVREQVSKSVTYLMALVHSRHKGHPKSCEAYSCREARAALDALKGE